MNSANETSPIAFQQNGRKAAQAVTLGLVANIILSILKTGFGILGHSPALLADGINSTSDVAYYVVVAIFLRLARKPADETHPYGHSQLESIASILVGAFVITTAVAIFWNSINNAFELWMGEVQSVGAAQITLWIALFTVLFKIILTQYTRRIGERSNNAAILALAYDHRNDVFSASAAAIGIFLGLNGYTWFDPLVGSLVALLILRTGVEIIRQSSAELMDVVPSRALSQQITKLLSSVPEIESIEEIHAHRFGPYLVINITIGVDGDMSVEEGDRIATEVEDVVYDSNELIRRVYVHYHPSASDEPIGKGIVLPESIYKCDLHR